MALVVYARDEEGNWHIAEGAAADGSRALTEDHPKIIAGNSLLTEIDEPLKFEYANLHRTFPPVCCLIVVLSWHCPIIQLVLTETRSTAYYASTFSPRR